MTFLRYIATQLAAYSIDMGLFLVLTYFGQLGPIIANAIAKLAAGIFAFITHRKFTFKLQKSNHNRAQIYRYFMLLGLNVPVSSVILWLLLFVVEHAVVAKVITDIAMVMLNFWLSRTWVFRPEKKYQELESQPLD